MVVICRCPKRIVNMKLDLTPTQRPAPSLTPPKARHVLAKQARSQDHFQYARTHRFFHQFNRELNGLLSHDSGKGFFKPNNSKNSGQKFDRHTANEFVHEATHYSKLPNSKIRRKNKRAISYITCTINSNYTQPTKKKTHSFPITYIYQGHVSNFKL